MKKIAWLLVAALLFSVLPVGTGMGEVQAVDNILPDNTVITSEHIPDETLLEVIKNTVGKTWDDKVTYGQLQGITELVCDETTTSAKGLVPVKTLEGIEYLVELEKLYITGQNVTDLTPIGLCGNLRTLYADDNKITAMPNLTNRFMSACCLDRNHLSEAILRASFPTSVGTLETTCAKQLAVEPTEKASSKYYEVIDKSGASYYPFVMAVDQLRQMRDYTVKTITVDGTDYTDKFKVEIKQNYEAPFDYNVAISADADEFLSVSEVHKIEIVIEDEYEETILIKKDFTLEPMQKHTVINVEEPEYFSCNTVRQTGIRLEYREFMTKSSGVTVKKVELKNQEGTVYATAQNVYSHPSYNYNDERYTDADVRNKCYNAMADMIGNGNICSIALGETAMSINTWDDIEPGFYDVVFTLSDDSTYTYSKAYEAVTRPIVYSVLDASQSVENSSIMTDQTGDYVSVYVYGWNITKDTVKPVFYDGRQEISSDVEAVETGTWGSFFRIKKLEDIKGGTDFGGFYSFDRLPTTDTEGDVWDIPLSTDRWETTKRVGYKTYDVVIETEEETFEKKAQIIRREIYSQSYDQRDKTYTVYFAQEADVDKEYNPTLTFQKYSYNETSDAWGYFPFTTAATGTFKEETNALTGQKELKAEFVLNNAQIQAVKDNFYDFCYGVSYKTAEGEKVEFRSEYDYIYTEAEPSVEDVPTKGRVEGLTDTIFYLPYWIGGVYEIEANNSPKRYLTEEEVADLKVGKYAYASAYPGVTKENSSFIQRSSQYYFWEKAEPITPPTGTPNLTATKDGDKWKLSWNSIADAQEYVVYFRYNDSLRIYSVVSDTNVSLRAESLPMVFQELFEECRANPDESKMEIFVRPMAVKNDDSAEGAASNVLTVAGIRKSLEVHTHTPSSSPKITKANASNKKPGYNQTVCKTCGAIIKTNATYYYPKSVTVSTVTYNGKSQTPKVVVKDSKGKTISSSHYSVSKVKKVGKSTITITFKSSSKYYTGKLTAKCTVNPSTTKFTKVSAGKKKVTLKWSKKTSEVTGYYIECSTDKKFKKGVKKVTVKKNKTTSTTISKLKSKKKYYVRIRTYKGSYKSSWSSVKSVKVK